MYTLKSRPETITRILLIAVIFFNALITSPIKGQASQTLTIDSTATATATNTVTATPTSQACTPTATYTSQPNGTSGVDMYMSSGSANSTHETNATISIGEDNAATNYYRRGLLKFDLS